MESGGSERDFWASVGIPSRGTALHEAIHDGFSVSVCENLANLAEMDHGTLCKSIAIPPSTYRRRVQHGQFNLGESDRLYRFAKALKAAIDLFEGDRIKARDWLLKPTRGLGGRRPVEMVVTSAETEGLLDLIGRLEHGVAV